jgi:hypothetical protein
MIDKHTDTKKPEKVHPEQEKATTQPPDCVLKLRNEESNGVFSACQETSQTRPS